VGWALQGFYDRDGIEQDALCQDWSMCMAKERFRKLVEKWQPGASVADDAVVLDTVV
jgi:hypothetical protein